VDAELLRLAFTVLQVLQKVHANTALGIALVRMLPVSVRSWKKRDL
jgi:hypothetical protein